MKTEFSIADGIAKSNGVSYEGMLLQGDIQFTQLGWEMFKLGITPIMINNVLREYYCV